MRHILLGLLVIGCGDGSTSGPTDGNSDGIGDDGGGGEDAEVFVPGHHVENPEAHAGGGVGSGEIDGEINVFVTDSASGDPIEGADVRIGAADAKDPLTGETDEDGLVVFQDPSLSGAQIVTAGAQDYPSATWFGVGGAVVTIPLESSATPTVPTATVSGTFTDFDALTPSVPGNFLFAAISYSTTEDFDAPENDVQGLQGANPLNYCLRIPPLLVDPCAWTLVTRTGRMAIYAIVFESDSSGAAFLRGYAIKRGYDLQANDNLTNEDLVLIPGSDMIVPPTITYGTTPAAAPDVTTLSILHVGDEGQIFTVGTDVDPSATIPDLVGNLATATYDIVGTAADAANGTPQTAIVARDVDVTMSVDIGQWLGLPENLAETSGEFSFAPVAGASLHAVSFTDVGTGDPLWNVVVLDDTDAFMLPDDPWTGDTDMDVTALEVTNFDPEDFVGDSLATLLTRTSSAAITFTP